MYPEGLEVDLDRHFQRIVATRRGDLIGDVRRGLDAAEITCQFDPARIATSSRLPGGAALHRSVGRLVSRQTQGVLEQVREFADAVVEVLRSMLAAYEELSGRVDHLLDQMPGAERPSGVESGDEPSDTAADEPPR